MAEVCLHPFIDDLKMKSFMTSIAFSEEEVGGRKFLRDFAAACRKMSPLQSRDEIRGRFEFYVKHRDCWGESLINIWDSPRQSLCEGDASGGTAQSISGIASRCR